MGISLNKKQKMLTGVNVSLVICALFARAGI